MIYLKADVILLVECNKGGSNNSENEKSHESFLNLHYNTLTRLICPSSSNSLKLSESHPSPARTFLGTIAGLIPGHSPGHKPISTDREPKAGMPRGKAASKTKSPSVEVMEVDQTDKVADEAEVEGAVAEEGEGEAEVDGDEEEEGEDENEFEVEAIADHKHKNVSSGRLSQMSGLLMPGPGEIYL